LVNAEFSNFGAFFTTSFVGCSAFPKFPMRRALRPPLSATSKRQHATTDVCSFFRDDLVRLFGSGRGRATRAIRPAGAEPTNTQNGAPNYTVYVSNEVSGDVSVIDPNTNSVTASIPVGKRPRGIHASPDGTRVYVALSGSPRMAPGVDQQRGLADRTADGIAVIDGGKKTAFWRVGSDPE
jgi:YVTN family beta-propeller protein